MKFIIVWAVIVFLENQGSYNEFVQKTPDFESEPMCIIYTERYTDRMKDVIRGANDIPFEAEVHVQGNCQVKGLKDAKEAELH